MLCSTTFVTSTINNEMHKGNMADESKPEASEGKPWTRLDEENLLLEISADRRLVRLGIDPDGDPLEIWLELKRRMEEIERQKAQRS
jgi:hypothetical protein